MTLVAQTKETARRLRRKADSLRRDGQYFLEAKPDWTPRELATLQYQLASELEEIAKELSDGED